MSRAVVLCRCVVLVLLFGAPAGAFCRATTCDPGSVVCQLDDHGCARDGAPLAWRGGCLMIDVSQAGSRLRNIGFGEIEKATSSALEDWATADCGERSRPTFAFSVMSVSLPALAAAGGIDRANIVRFRDEDWPYHNLDSSVALTTLTFVATTGEIIDADIELNSHARSFNEAENVASYDLKSVLRHEIGHLLGLGHSDAGSSAMLPRYVAKDVGNQFLSGDDEAAVCSAYPPSRSVPECQQEAARWVPCESLEGCRILAAWFLGAGWLVMGALVWVRVRYVRRRQRFRVSELSRLMSP